MRNRAKCKLCGIIIESSNPDSKIWVSCSCREISISGGNSEYLVAVNTSYDNLLRIDDNGNEIPVKVEKSERQDTKEEAFEVKPDREQLLNMLLDQINNSESLPMHVRQSFVTYVELEAFMLLVYAILKAP